jgi:sterol desaturase/sphingolipid hydroxylase (fatty acid hydroxylase superfamily)
MFGIYHVIAAGLFAAFALFDFAARGRVFPEVPNWKLKGLAFAALYFSIATFAPLMWDGLLGQYQLADGSALPLWAQIATGFLVLQLLIYAWHRTMHNVQPLWRWLHQMHHSAERVDIWGAFYFHPFDMIGWALLGSMALVLGIGLTAEAAIAVSLLATFCSMFQHANIRTPRWLGYLITRPESHSVHHQRGLHAYNYGDIPLFDMIFGTFRNPREFDGEVGFFEGSSRKIVAMLAGREIA